MDEIKNAYIPDILHPIDLGHEVIAQKLDLLILSRYEYSVSAVFSNSKNAKTLIYVVGNHDRILCD